VQQNGESGEDRRVRHGGTPAEPVIGEVLSQAIPEIAEFERQETPKGFSISANGSSAS
jgi:hypothetical protein